MKTIKLHSHAGLVTHRTPQPTSRKALISEHSPSWAGFSSATGKISGLLCLLLALACQLARAADTFTQTGSLHASYYGHTTTLLHTGRVLAVTRSTTGQATAELYNPASGTWEPATAPSSGRYDHNAVMLNSGKVLLVGGYGNAGSLATCLLYNPESDNWSATGSLATARRYATATMLNTGKVLVVGGQNVNGGLSSAELYNPATGAWTSAGSLSTLRQAGHTATLLPNGNVLLVGGFGTSDYLSSVQIYNPSTNSWSSGASLAIKRGEHSATLLRNGKVLVIGGYSSTGVFLLTSQLYDPITNTWAAQVAIPAGMTGHSVTPLVDGRLLVAGGAIPGNVNQASKAAYIYSPSTGGWSGAANFVREKSSHTATILPNGKILVAGGYTDSTTYDTAEIYESSAAVLESARPTITTAAFNSAGKLVITGGNFRGTFGSSDGSTKDSSTGYPIVILRLAGSSTDTYLVPDPAVGFTSTGFTSLPVTSFPLGMATVTVVVQGVPSTPVNVALPTPAIPAISGLTSSSITRSTATLGGNVVNDGNSAILERGIVYANASANSDPKPGGAGVTTMTVSGTTGTYTANITGLTANTDYLFRAYARNAKGTSYTAAEYIHTLPLSLATVASPSANSVTDTTATVNANVTDDGGATITSRGIVFARTADNGNPAIGGANVTNQTVTGTTGMLSKSLISLAPGTSFTFRAYATNSKGTAYSPPLTFATLSDNANLSALTTNPSVLTPPFNPAIANYSAIVSHGVTQLSITATTAWNTASASINGGIVTTGSVSGTVPLNVGMNFINVSVTAQNGVSTKLHSLAVRRLSQLETWRQKWFGSPENAGYAENLADPFNTGVSNLQVYAFLGMDQDPRTARTSQLPQLQMIDDTPGFSFLPPIMIEGITYGAESSTTLKPGSWTPVPNTGVGATRVFKLPAGQYPSIFMRLSTKTGE